MTNIISLKEKLKNISDFLEKIENKGFSKIEKDILLQMLRDYYLEVSEFGSQEQINESFAIVNKISEPEAISKPDELEKQDYNDNIDLDFVENSDEQKLENVAQEQVSEVKIEDKPVEEVKVKPAETSTQPQVKKIVAEQTSLFGSNNSSGKTIGEQLGNSKTSINEVLAQKTKPADITSRLKPVTDIKSAIGVGDRFLFVRELFAGNSESFEETVAHLNTLSSYQEANDFLKAKFQWDDSQSTVTSFLNIVKRRYV
ncbi:MAG TPA: hypothetical protein PLL66_08955 [Bacteroidales bacterium]|nr:hypothetical protein [Bacteroidales bacterium]